MWSRQCRGVAKTANCPRVARVSKVVLDQAWVGRCPPLAASWAGRWRAVSRRPWAVAWTYFVQSVEAARDGYVGQAERAEAAGVTLTEAQVLETDWNAAFGVLWREDAPPTWDDEDGLDALLVPPPPASWRTLRAHWRATSGLDRFAGPWAVLQWALRCIPLRQEVGQTFQIDAIAAQIGASSNSTRKWKSQLVAAGLLIEERLTGRAGKLRWSASFEQGGASAPPRDQGVRPSSPKAPPAPPEPRAGPDAAAPQPASTLAFTPSPDAAVPTLAQEQIMAFYMGLHKQWLDHQQAVGTPSGTDLTMVCPYFTLTSHRTV